jgi:hypothetical protein
VSNAIFGSRISSSDTRSARSRENPFRSWIVADLVRFQVEQTLQHLALHAHRDVLARSHRERAGQQPGDAGEHDDRAALRRAREPHDQRRVREETVVHAEDRCPERAALARRSGGLRASPAAAFHAAAVRQQVVPLLETTLRVQDARQLSFRSDVFRWHLGVSHGHPSCRPAR